MKVFAVLDGLGCAECADAVERRLEKTDGVRWARVHLPTETLAVDTEAVDDLDERLRGWLAASRVRLLGAYPTRRAAERASVARLEERVKSLALRFGVSAALAGLVWTEGWTDLSPYSLAVLSLALLLVCGAPLQSSLIHAFRHRRADASSVLALAAWAAGAHVALAAWLAPASGASLSGWLALLVLVGIGSKEAEAVRRRRSAADAERLTRSLVATARVAERGRETRKPVAELQPGTRVIVLPGEALPVDGEVVEGESEVDESFLLGQSAVASKSPGCRVLAGSKNGAGRLDVAASRWGEASLLGTLIEAIRDGQSERWSPPAAADRYSARLGPAAISLALASFAWWLYSGLSIEGLSASLAVLAFSVPPTLLAAGPLARWAAPEDEKVRWLEDDAAERAVGLELIVLGMTGLFTATRPKVSAVLASAGSREDEVLGLAMVAAAVPEHPYADAVRRCAALRGLSGGEARPSGLDYYPGRGVRAMVGGDEVWIGSPDWIRSRGVEDRPELANASLWIVRGSSVIGALEFANGLRPSARAAVKQLQRDGLEVVLASGDTELRVRETADELGVGTFHWGVSASDELALVSGLQARGKRVAAMARGLIDAPVLSQADLGFSLQAGLPGDVLLEKPDAASVPLALERARQVRLASRLNVCALWAAQAGAGVWTAIFGVSVSAACLASSVGLVLAAASTLAVRKFAGGRHG